MNRRLGQLARHVGLAVGGVFMLGPVLLMVRGAVAPTQADLFGGGFTADHIRTALAQVPIARTTSTASSSAR